MKLVFVNRFYWPDESATSQILTDLCIHLASTGYDVHVIASRKRYDDAEVRLPAKEHASGVHIHRVWTSRFGRMNLAGRVMDYATFYFSCAWRLHSLVRVGDVVVAETDPPLVSIVAAWVCRLRRASLVNWVQDVFPEIAQRIGLRWLRGPLGGLLRALRDRSLRMAAANVALSDGMAAHLRRCAPQARMLVLHNWSDGSKVQPIEREDNVLRREWGLASHFVVGYSGNMGRAHEFDTILEACERLRRREDIAFLFIGGGPQCARIHREVGARRLSNVHFRPFQPRARLALSLGVPDVHIVSLLPALDGLIVPSKFYGIAAAGRATIFIGLRAGDLGTLVDAQGIGETVQSGDVAGLVQTIERLAAHEDRVRELGMRARALFDVRFQMGLALAEWDALIESIAALPARPARY